MFEVVDADKFIEDFFANGLKDFESGDGEKQFAGLCEGQTNGAFDMAGMFDTGCGTEKQMIEFVVSGVS